MFVTLKPFDQRTSRDLSGMAIAQKLQAKFAGINDAIIAIFPPPPVKGLGTIGGFKLQVEDRTDQGDEALDQVMSRSRRRRPRTPGAEAVFSNFNIGVPQLFAHLDRTKAHATGRRCAGCVRHHADLSGLGLCQRLQPFRPHLSGDRAGRHAVPLPAEDIVQLQVRNATGQMVPLGAVVNVSETTGPDTAMRYNGFRAADLNGGPAPGYSTGQAQAAITKILDETLPKGMRFEWTDLTYQQILAGQHRAAGVSALRAAGLPGAGRAI